MKITKAICVVMLAVLSISLIANASVITFDDLPDPGSTDLFIPDGHAGFSWENFHYINGSVWHPGSGYENGTISGYVAYNGHADDATMVISSVSAFDFQGAYLTSAWNNGLNITVNGYANNALIDTQTVVVDTTGPTWFDFDFIGVDSLEFQSFGGVGAGLGGGGEHFVLENFTFVPEPMTLSLLALGGLLIRKRR